MSTLHDTLSEIKRELGEQSIQLRNIGDAVLGAEGRPGLSQKVEDLEASRNKVWGGLTVLTVLWGFIESMIHLGKK